LSIALLAEDAHDNSRSRKQRNEAPGDPGAVEASVIVAFVI